MQKWLPLVLCIVSLTAAAQPGHDIIIGKIDSLHSQILGEERRIWVHVPGQGNGPLFRSNRYPVVYLLDGDAHFPSVMGMIQQLTEVNGNSLFPNMILVGIPNTDRGRDLTPTPDTTVFHSSGGGEKFTSFIQQELIPHIDSLYPTAPYRVLIGHSLGGLMVINALVNHPDLFNAYLAIDPSMWWDKQKLLKQTETVLAQRKFAGKTLYLAVANTMPDGMDTAKVRKDTTEPTRHIRSILRLAADVKKNSGNGLRFSWKYYPGDTHSSVPLISEYDGLRFMFDYYPFKLDRIFDPKYPADSAITLFKAHYRLLSERMGYAMSPPEDLVNGLGYSFLRQKQLARCIAFFTMNTLNYPNSGNTFDSLGDGYSAAGDHQKAVDAYTKALSLWDNPDTRKKLAEEKTKLR